MNVFFLCSRVGWMYNYNSLDGKGFVLLGSENAKRLKGTNIVR